jgi:predicted GIY-YIG superfamily endonuclease
MSEEANKKHYWLYILKLEQGKYYVGQTASETPDRRIKQHLQGFYSAKWVKKYSPIGVAETIDLGTTTKTLADLAEQHYTANYMKQFGYQNVRGGRYNYQGKYLKFGSSLIEGYKLESFFVGLLLIACSIYIFTHR